MPEIGLAASVGVPPAPDGVEPAAEDDEGDLEGEDEEEGHHGDARLVGDAALQLPPPDREKSVQCC